MIRAASRCGSQEPALPAHGPTYVLNYSHFGGRAHACAEARMQLLLARVKEELQGKVDQLKGRSGFSERLQADTWRCLLATMSRSVRSHTGWPN